jgi:cytochrome c
VKPMKCRRNPYLVAALVSLTAACQLLDGGARDNRSKTTATSSARPSSPPTPKFSEREEPAANATAAATDETSEPVPCAAAEFNYPAVKAACSEGGRNAVKKIMHGAIAKAKRAGTELKCANCHVDQKTFGLRPNAVDDLANWL